VSPATQSQSPIPRQPIGATFVVAISVLGFFLIIQFLAVAWFFLPRLQQQVVESATVASAPPVAEVPAAPSGTTSTPEKPAPDPALVQRINRLVADSDKAYRVGDSESALKGIVEADGILPNDPGILLRKARLLESMQEPAQASAVYAQVLAIPSLAPDLQNQAAKKLEQLGGVAASASPSNAVADEQGPDVRDEIGLQPGSNLGIVDARLRDGSTGMKVLRIAIKSRPNFQVDTRLMKLHVFFYEKDDSGDIQLTESKVVSQWISPPVNWADNEPELLDVNYILPESELAGSAASNGSPGRTFVGYIVGVYYNSELQDTRAEPGNLAKKFPLPLYLKQDAQ
jgi:tetratricopeptide (TPR) repeat protein